MLIQSTKQAQQDLQFIEDNLANLTTSAGRARDLMFAVAALRDFIQGVGTNKVQYVEGDSTAKAVPIAIAMVNAVHPDDRSTSTYEDAANEASRYIDGCGIGCPDDFEILKVIAPIFDVADLWDFSS